MRYNYEFPEKELESIVGMMKEFITPTSLKRDHDELAKDLQKIGTILGSMLRFSINITFKDEENGETEIGADNDQQAE